MILVVAAHLSKVDDIVGQTLVRRPVPVVVGETIISMGTMVGKIVGIRVRRQLKKILGSSCHKFLENLP
jgi:hypothetical protein